jgi:hypothetical protein
MTSTRARCNNGGRAVTIGRRLHVIVLVAGLATALLACSPDDQSAPSAPDADLASSATATADSAPTEPETTSGSTEMATSRIAEGGPTSADVEALVAAGVSIVPSEDEPVDTTVTDAGHLMVTAVQARRMMADVSPDGGLLGADIDATIALPADVPALSYVIAGWVSMGSSESSARAREWMGDQDWAHAPMVRFPLAVLALFVTELSIATAEDVPALEHPLAVPTVDEIQSTDSGANGFRRVVDARSGLPADGPCTAVTQFLSQSITGIFNALRIVPPQGNGAVSAIGQVLAGVVNFGLGLAKTVVDGLVSAITAPVLNLIAIAVAAVGVVVVVASFFKDENLTVSMKPASNTRFAVGPEPDITGEFVATARDLTGDWPPVLQNCARAAGASLPELLPAGNPVEWQVADKSLITTTSPRSGVVDGDHTAHLTFVTGREPKDHGAAEFADGVVADVRIPRKEVDAILDLARSKVMDAQASILSKVPGELRGPATVALNSVVNPTLDQLQGEVSKVASGVFSLSGRGILFVVHHGPPDTTIPPTSAPDTAPPDTGEDDDFCTQYRALVEFSQGGPDDVVAWATAIVGRLQTMRPIAPAEVLADVDVEIRVYTAVATSADVTVLIQTTEPLPQAAAHVGAFCGLTGG